MRAELGRRDGGVRAGSEERAEGGEGAGGRGVPELDLCALCPSCRILDRLYPSQGVFRRTSEGGRPERGWHAGGGEPRRAPFLGLLLAAGCPPGGPPGGRRGPPRGALSRSGALVGRLAPWLLRWLVGALVGWWVGALVGGLAPWLLGWRLGWLVGWRPWLVGWRLGALESSGPLAPWPVAGIKVETKLDFSLVCPSR